MKVDSNNYFAVLGGVEFEFTSDDELPAISFRRSRSPHPTDPHRSSVNSSGSGQRSSHNAAGTNRQMPRGNVNHIGPRVFTGSGAGTRKKRVRRRPRNSSNSKPSVYNVVR